MSEHAIIYSALAILLLPLLSYVILFFFGKKLPRKGDWVGVGLLGTTWLLALASSPPTRVFSSTA